MIENENKDVIAAPEPQSLAICQEIAEPAPMYRGQEYNKTRNDETIEELSYIPPEAIKVEDIKVNLINKVFFKKRRMLEMNLIGIENLKKVGIAIAKIVDAGIKSKSDDGKITWGDITHFIKVIPAIITAIPALSHIKEELNTKITTAQVQEFKESVLSEIEIKNEYDSEFVNRLFDVLHTIAKLVVNRIERSKIDDDEQQQ